MIPVVVSPNEIGREASHCFSNGSLTGKSIPARGSWPERRALARALGQEGAWRAQGGGEASRAAVQGVRARMGSEEAGKAGWTGLQICGHVQEAFISEKKR